MRGMKDGKMSDEGDEGWENGEVTARTLNTGVDPQNPI